ncbi:hypothetical protein Tco_0461664 [Tanacetum coccineum]
MDDLDAEEEEIWEVRPMVQDQAKKKVSSSSIPSESSIVAPVLVDRAISSSDSGMASFVAPRHQRTPSSKSKLKDARVSIALRIDNTLPLVENADSEATEEAYLYEDGIVKVKDLNQELGQTYSATHWTYREGIRIHMVEGGNLNLVGMVEEDKQTELIALIIIQYNEPTLYRALSAYDHNIPSLTKDMGQYVVPNVPLP